MDAVTVSVEWLGHHSAPLSARDLPALPRYCRDIQRHGGTVAKQRIPPFRKLINRDLYPFRRRRIRLHVPGLGTSLVFFPDISRESRHPYRSERPFPCRSSPYSVEISSASVPGASMVWSIEKATTAKGQLISPSSASQRSRHPAP